jgi:hypothetical protein
MRKIFMVSAVLFAVLPASVSGAIWSDGFESGDMSQWDSFSGNFAPIAVQTSATASVPIEGSYMATVPTDPPLSAYSYSSSASKSFSPALTGVTLTGYMKKDSTQPTGNARIGVNCPTAGHYIAVRFSGDSLYVDIGGGQTTVNSGTFEVDEWVKVSIYTGGEVCRIYVNDVYVTTGYGVGWASIDGVYFGGDGAPVGSVFDYFKIEAGEPNLEEPDDCVALRHGYSEYALPYDLDRDCRIGFGDLMLMASLWLTE